MLLNLIIIPLSVFLFSLIVHIIVWRIKIPKSSIKFLIIIFLIIPIIISTFYYMMVNYRIIKFLSMSLFECFGCILLSLSAGFAYIMTYPAFQANIPSLKILYYIKSAKSKGLSINEIHELFQEKEMIEFRVYELQHDNLISIDNQNLKLTSRGNLLASFFGFYRKLLGLKPGEG